MLLFSFILHNLFESLKKLGVCMVMQNVTTPSPDKKETAVGVREVFDFLELVVTRPLNPNQIALGMTGRRMVRDSESIEHRGLGSGADMYIVKRGERTLTVSSEHDWRSANEYTSGSVDYVGNIDGKALSGGNAKDLYILAQRYHEMHQTMIKERA